jgi:hypothetical protein
MKLSWTTGQIGTAPEMRVLVDLYRDEMIARGFGSTWSNSDVFHQSTIWINDEPISTMLYAPLYDSRVVHCSGAYTARTWRRLGIYNQLWLNTVNMWRVEGELDILWSGFNNRNEISRAMQMAQGRKISEVHAHATRTKVCLKPTGNEWPIEGGLDGLYTRLRHLVDDQDVAC